MKNLITKTTLFLFGLVAIYSCETGPCIHGNDDIITNTRNIGYFDGVKTMGNFNVRCVNDSTFDLELTGESNILPYISTEIYNDVLQVKEFPNTCLKENYTVTVKAYCPELTSVTIAGSGNAEFDNYTGNTLDLNISGSGSIIGTLYYNKLYSTISGSGDMELYGEVEYGDYEINGSGTVRALNLQHKNVVVNISGSGDVFIHCTNSLTVNISGSGNVYFVGYPQIFSDISGSGSIINYN